MPQTSKTFLAIASPILRVDVYPDKTMRLIMKRFDVARMGLLFLSNVAGLA
jgi:hypothetical protein